jgi:hypothetical protein
MGTYALLSDVKKIMRASSRERIRFSEDAFRSMDIGILAEPAQGPYNQSKYPKPQYNLIFRKENVIISNTYKFRTLLNFVFTSDTEYNVYFQSFVDNAYDKREMLHGSGDIGGTYDYDGLIQFPSTCWAGVIGVGATVKIVFEADISTEDAEFFILNAEVAIDNMLSAAAVDYLLVGEDRLFEIPDIPPAITMAAQYMAAFYIYTNAYAEQSKESPQGHFTDRWRKMAMDILTNFAIHKNRLPPHVAKRLEGSGSCNWDARVREYFNVTILKCLDTELKHPRHLCGSCSSTTSCTCHSH